MELLKKLSEMPGAPGREELVREFIIEQIKSHVDDYRVDAMGNLICHKKAKDSSAERVMLACHMDEIAFIVRHIDSKGFVRIQQLGGFDTRNLFARRVRIQTRDGKEIFGNLHVYLNVWHLYHISQLHVHSSILASALTPIL